MTLRDAVLLTNGFTNEADKKSILVIRNETSLNNNNLTKEIIVDFSSNDYDNNNIEIYPNDIISVRKIPFFQDTESYFVNGQVKVNGPFAINKKNHSVIDAFRENIELLESASIDGIYVERDSIKIPIEGKLISNKFLPESELVLKSGDEIFISKKDNTITIIGSVQQESIIDYKKSINFKNAISRAGGFLENADKKRAYIEYQNGQKKSANSFLGFLSFPKLRPGAKIIVPIKDENKLRTSVGEIVGYTTSLVSIIALIKSL